MVRFRAIAAAVLTMVLVSGCESTTQRRSAQAPVWEDLTTVVPASPEFPIGGPVETNLAVVPKSPSNPPPFVPRPTETWVPMQRWSRANNLCLLTQIAGRPAPAYALQSTNGVFVLRTGSQLAQWDGLEVRLGFAPQLIDGQPYVHTLDLYKTIQPLLQGGPPPILHPNPVVVIDPGHGGENAGTRSVLGNHYEKEYTLDWALRLQSLLAANNYRAYLTRSNDMDLALSNRVAFAAEHRADVFLSLHFNSAAPNETEAGLETYCLTPAGMPSSLTRGFPDELQQSFPNNAFDAQNLYLALRVHRALLQVNGRHDRGIRRARFPGVLRNQQRAAILVEGGYLSNPQEARQISDPAYRQRLAEAVAKALLVSTGTGMVAFNAQNTPAEHPTSSQASVERSTNSSAGVTQTVGQAQTTSQGASGGVSDPAQ
jgi:N-acetylmuramoyl-L-alanine amidase